MSDGRMKPRVHHLQDVESAHWRQTFRCSGDARRSSCTKKKAPLASRSESLSAPSVLPDFLTLVAAECNDVAADEVASRGRIDPRRRGPPALRQLAPRAEVRDQTSRAKVRRDIRLKEPEEVSQRASGERITAFIPHPPLHRRPLQLVLHLSHL